MPQRKIGTRGGPLTLDGAPFVPGRTVAAIVKLLNGLPSTEVLRTRELASRLHMKVNTLLKCRESHQILLNYTTVWGRLVIWGNQNATKEAKQLITGK